MAEITQEELAQIITASLADSIVKALPAPGSSIDLFAKVPASAGGTVDVIINITKLDPSQSNGQDYAVAVGSTVVTAVTAAGIAEAAAGFLVTAAAGSATALFLLSTAADPPPINESRNSCGNAIHNGLMKGGAGYGT